MTNKQKEIARKIFENAKKKLKNEKEYKWNQIESKKMKM